LLAPNFGYIAVVFVDTGSNMVTRREISLALLCCLFVSFGPVQESVALQSTPNSGRLIVSTTRPKDSRGETVYEGRGSAQNQPAVSGVFVQPSPIKLPDPKYPKSLKKAHADLDVTVEGVTSESGDYIDATIISPIEIDPEIERSALDAVSRYKFKPATLDGKPIALLTRVVIHFRIR
jgi:TonB family protein